MAPCQPVVASRDASTFVPATKVKKPNARRGSRNSTTNSRRKTANRQTVSRHSAAQLPAHTASRAVDSAAKPCICRPTERMPLAMTRAK